MKVTKAFSTGLPSRVTLPDAWEGNVEDAWKAYYTQQFLTSGTVLTLGLLCLEKKIMTISTFSLKANANDCIRTRCLVASTTLVDWLEPVG